MRGVTCLSRLNLQRGMFLQRRSVAAAAAAVAVSVETHDCAVEYDVPRQSDIARSGPFSPLKPSLSTLPDPSTDPPTHATLQSFLLFLPSLPVSARYSVVLDM